MILDTFYVLFKSNSDDLKKGANEAVKTTDKVDKSLKAAENSSTKLGSSFSGMIGKASAAFAALFSVGALVSGVFASIEHTNAIGDLSKKLSYSTEELDAWGGAVKAAGGDAGSFYSTIEAMDKKLRQSGSKKKFIDMLPGLADRFQGLSAGKAQDLGATLGLDQGTVMLLQKGSKEISTLIARQKELGLVTKLDTEVARKFSLQQDDTSHAFRSLYVAIATDVLPLFEKVLKFFEKAAIFIREHKNVVIGGLVGIGAALLAIVDVGKVLNKVFSKWFLFVSILAAIGTAVGLLYDDFKVFQAGGDSVIGDLVKKYPKLGEIISKIGDVVQDVTKYFEKMETTPFDILLTSMNLIIDALETIYKVGKPVWEILGAIGKGVGAGAELLGYYSDDASKNRDSASALNEITKQNQEKLARIKGVSGGINDFDRSKIATGGSSVFNNGGPQSKTTNVSTGPVTINTQATDAAGIAGAFSLSLNKQIGFAQNNYDDGVRA